jgi:predicted alpha/beta superfamily hydrolase
MLATTFFLSAQTHVTLRVTSLPPHHPSNDSLFVAGSFNGWNPHDAHRKMQRDKNGNYFIGLDLDKGEYSFKITRGDWKKVECNIDGSMTANHHINLEKDTAIDISIAQWSDRFPEIEKRSTASPNVKIVDTAFYIPQLKRTRRVWIYLPAGYTISQQSYPVLYMQDGQNVFDDATSFAGEWGVDETLDSISRHKKEMIVVAVDNDGQKRMNEYNPYDNEKFGKGEGDAYVDFLVQTLKPFIDKHYRTIHQQEGTFIAGSSLGALISMYAVLKYPKVFGGAGIFSPSFWIAPQIFDLIKTKGKNINTKIYFYCGKQEGEGMESNMTRAFQEMRANSQARMITVVRPDGHHSETTWREEFPLFYLWLTEK